MNYIVFDLEATCDDKTKIKNEVIEIGAVKLNENLEIIEEFQSFINPKLNKTLTDFCKQLTSIKQDDVDYADTFEIVIEKFKTFIGNEYKLCSWGFYDKNQFISDCELHNLNKDWIKNHISLKHQHQDFNKMRKGVGVQRALTMDKFVFEGTHHRGIDDARNISKIFVKNFNKWKF